MSDSKIEEIQSPAVAENEQASREIPVIIEQNSSQSSSYSVASVAAVILAGSLFIWGGFTGQKGWDKLVAVEDWIASFFQ
jgi:hypothetical protein